MKNLLFIGLILFLSGCSKQAVTPQGEISSEKIEVSSRMTNDRELENRYQRELIKAKDTGKELQKKYENNSEFFSGYVADYLADVSG
ncbi:hypothetical protein ACWOFR_09745 [Carnobacterium gallinarum]|uniref:hypothetical protein n=1 Tax=Carnobacterium gallinarum TaxID=2749 RepID=UPI0005541536|nr:hypothetical protein [Carnobacterium gallinarum]